MFCTGRVCICYEIQKTVKIIVLHILVFAFLDSKLENKRFCTERKKTFPDFNLLLIPS